MGNITENKLNTVISAADLTSINTSISGIKTKIPGGGSLTDEQRGSMKSIDVENKVFVEDVITETNLNGAGIIPSYVVVNNVVTDITFFEQLDTIESDLSTVLQRISDLKRIAGDEAYTAALVIYKLFESANNAGINTAKQSYEKLKLRFENQGSGGRPASTDL